MVAVGEDVVVVIVVVLLVRAIVVPAAVVFSVPAVGDLSKGDDELEGAAWCEIEAFASALSMTGSGRDSVGSAGLEGVRLELLDPATWALAVAAIPAAVTACVEAAF